MRTTVEQALRRVQDGRKAVAEQRRRISDLTADGSDIAEAKQILAEYERTQHIFEADLKRAIASE